MVFIMVDEKTSHNNKRFSLSYVSKEVFKCTQS